MNAKIKINFEVTKQLKHLKIVTYHEFGVDYLEPVIIPRLNVQLGLQSVIKT